MCFYSSLMSAVEAESLCLRLTEKIDPCQLLKHYYISETFNENQELYILKGLTLVDLVRLKLFLWT